MSSKEIVREFITNELLDKKILTVLTDEDQLIDMGIIDSLGIMTLLVFLEEKYNIRISSDDLIPENFSTINAISDLVERQLKR